MKEINEQHAIDMENMQKGLASGQIKLKDDVIAADLLGLDEATNQKNSGDAIPREPEKLKIKGHRARVTKVAFHPFNTLVASSSEDGSVKIWEYETGECE